MDYYSVDFAAGTKLGISVICRSSTQPLLGTTLVESVADKNSFAYVQGIRRGDFLVSVNGHYVSNIAHSKCIDILKSQLEKRIEIRIQLCRPNYFEWQQIRNDMNEIVHEGILQKQSGILKRWSPRYVKASIKRAKHCGVQYKLQSNVVPIGYKGNVFLLRRRSNEKEDKRWGPAIYKVALSCEFVSIWPGKSVRKRHCRLLNIHCLVDCRRKRDGV